MKLDGAGFRRYADVGKHDRMANEYRLSGERFRALILHAAARFEQVPTVLPELRLAVPIERPRQPDRDVTSLRSARSVVVQLQGQVEGVFASIGASRRIHGARIAVRASQRHLEVRFADAA